MTDLDDRIQSFSDFMKTLKELYSCDFLTEYHENQVIYWKYKLISVY